uniref:Uncharacterized protein n=1 Tax=Parascaris equorum TaxID=6256 RepID=A0A914RB24_PAREQ
MPSHLLCQHWRRPPKKLVPSISFPIVASLYVPLSDNNVYAY